MFPLYTGKGLDESPLNNYSQIPLSLRHRLLRLLLTHKIRNVFVSSKILYCLKHCFVSNISIGGVQKYSEYFSPQN